MKKVFFFFLFITVLALAVGYGYKKFGSEVTLSADVNSGCAFCSQDVLDAQKIYENEWVIALLSYKPITEGHILVIPKRHVERYELLLEEELLQINRVIKKVHTVSQQKTEAFSYLLLQKNGREVGQTVPHLHFHYIPQRIGNSPNSLLWGFFIQPFIFPIGPEEIHNKAIGYQEAFKSCDFEDIEND